MLHVQIFLVNILPAKPLDIEASTLQVHKSYDVEDTGQCFLFALDLKSRLKVN